MHFYLYGDSKIKSLPPSFDFTVAVRTSVSFPAFLLFDMENDSTAVICKIQKAKCATFGMTLSVTAIREIKINLTVLLNSILPPDPLTSNELDSEYTDGRQFIRVWYEKLIELPHEQSQQIVNVILRRNPDLADESYFTSMRDGDVPERVLYANDDVRRQVSDAIYSAFMFFGRRDFISQVTEEGILDFDLNNLFESKVCTTEDNKHCFRFNGKKLYLHKGCAQRYWRC